MRIVLLLAHCKDNYLVSIINIIKQVLKDLEIEIEVYQLTKLPYFEGTRNTYMESMLKAILKSKGVIAVCPVHMMGIHAAMQSFLDHATLYQQEYFERPLFAVTYSEWLGENEAAEKMLSAWRTLGGMGAGKLCLNDNARIEEIKERVEKNVEDFYRIIKQDRPEIFSNERIIYQKYKASLKENKSQVAEPIQSDEKQIKSFAQMLKKEESFKEVIPFKEIPIEESSIDVSTKEQNIQEITNLLRNQFEKKGNEEFVGLDSGVYTRPVQNKMIKSTVTKKLQNLPHYFIAQHDKDLNIIVQYIVSDNDENGYIVVTDGDCSYMEGTVENPTVELTVTEDILVEILTKKLTYQKAFMLGKLKVRGNFVILSKLDQVFKTM